MFGIAAAVLIAFLSLSVPGVLLSFVLLRKTELHNFEIVVIGFIFGLLGPAAMTWLESYLMNYIHFFSFSLALFEANAVLLTLIGLAFAYKNGMLGELRAWAGRVYASVGASVVSVSDETARVRQELGKYNRGIDVIERHKEEERALSLRQQEEMSTPGLKAEEKETMTYSHRAAVVGLMKAHLSEERALAEELEGPRFSVEKVHWGVWAILIALMLVTLYTRMQSVVVAPSFFEFDPYYDMIDTHYILGYGQQLLIDHAAWPVIAAGVNHRIEPIVPYLEAYWYSLANSLHFHYAAFNTSLMSYVGGIYPPITAALLVFVVFMLLYHEYDERIALIGAGLASAMPILISTFIAGEQLVEPWGIMTLFFFTATFMLAIRNMKDRRLAVLAGIAFASTFLGAHYYTVTTGILAIYIFIQGAIYIMKKEKLTDFYKMNAIVIATMAIIYVLFLPYQSTLQNRVPSILHIPFTVSLPLGALLIILVGDYLIGYLTKRVIGRDGWYVRAGLIVAAMLVMLGAILFTPIGHPFKSYINLSTRFTTPSSPLFMTVQEFIPTGVTYNFGLNGFGVLGQSVGGLPIIVWLVLTISIALIIASILARGSKTGVLYLSIGIPLALAGFSEVKYMPHFGVAYIMLFCIMLGEILYLVQSGFRFSDEKKYPKISSSIYREKRDIAYIVLMFGLYFVFGVFVPLVAIAAVLYYSVAEGRKIGTSAAIAAFAVLLLFISISPQFRYGESASLMESISASVTYSAHVSAGTACSTLSSRNNVIGVSIYCNTIPQYWLNAMAWIRTNVGPGAPRVLAWWDYGDWINWFGNSAAVLRGDNAVPKEDYAVAAQYVLGGNYTPQGLARYMNGNQSRYVLFDQDLISKWGALNFLACIDTNQTSYQYAVQQGRAQSQPYQLGTSSCELAHDPQYALIPLAALLPSNGTQQNIGDYCELTSNSTPYIRTYLVTGTALANQTVCTSSRPNANGVLRLYDSNGTALNAVIQVSEYIGVQDVQNVPFVEYPVVYLPNGPNGTITDAPSMFYDSNYYKGFFLGKLPGFRQVYPNYTSGTNFINYTDPVRIYELVNYTGTLPEVPQKPPWIHNNDTMP